MTCLCPINPGIRQSARLSSTKAERGPKSPPTLDLTGSSCWKPRPLSTCERTAEYRRCARPHAKIPARASTPDARAVRHGRPGIRDWELRTATRGPVGPVSRRVETNQRLVHGGRIRGLIVVGLGWAATPPDALSRLKCLEELYPKVRAREAHSRAREGPEGTLPARCEEHRGALRALHLGTSHVDGGRGARRARASTEATTRANLLSAREHSSCSPPQAGPR